jgi:hypothetical protein
MHALDALIAISAPHITLANAGRVLAIWACVSAILWVSTWVLYLAVTSLQRALVAGTLTGAARQFGKVVLAMGLASDAALNWWFLTPVLLDVRAHWLVTQHLEVLMRRVDWRGRAARYLCGVWLDPFDPSGCHCRPRG